MSFIASEVVEPLDWDFSGLDGFGPEDKGTIPEPSPDQVDLFGQRYRGLLQQIYDTVSQDDTAVPGESTDAAAQRILEQAQKPLMQRLDEWADRTAVSREDIQRVNVEMCRILADVCSHQPSFDQLSRLPSRILRIFLGWVNEELTSPKLRDGALSSTKS